MTIVVTGANGHVGKQAIKAFSASHEVHAIVRSLPSEQVANVIYHVIDLSTCWVAASLPDRIDAVVHLAQSKNYKNFPEQALEIFNINVTSTALLLDYAHRAGARHFILTSTGGLHRPTSSIITENTLVDPPDGALSYYFRSKYTAELLANSYSPFMNVIIVRPFFIYGPDQAEDKLIPRLIALVRDGKPVRIIGKNGLVINPVFLDDVIAILTAAFQLSGSHVVMAAGPERLSIRELTEVIAKKVGIAPQFEFVDGDDELLVADHTAVEELLGHSLIPFRDGISRFIL